MLNSRVHHPGLAFFYLFLLLTFAHGVAANSLKFTTGVDISSGEYGESETTEIIYLPLTVKYSKFPWGLKLTVPYLQMRGPGSLVGGIDGAEVSSVGSTDSREKISGIGDVIAGVTWTADSVWNHGPFVDLTIKVKFPTADSDVGLGTGELDFQFELDIAQVYGQATPFAVIGWKRSGNSATTYYNAQWLASLGLDYRIQDSLSSGIIYDYRQASSEASVVRSELLGYLNWKITPVFSMNTYLVQGFSDSSADVAAGVQFTVTRK